MKRIRWMIDNLTEEDLLRGVLSAWRGRRQLLPDQFTAHPLHAVATGLAIVAADRHLNTFVKGDRVFASDRARLFLRFILFLIHTDVVRGLLPCGR